MISRREAILETIRLTLASIDPVAHGVQDYPYAFSKVGRQPPGEIKTTVRLIGTVTPGDEAKEMKMAFVDCYLQVVVDFAFTINRGDSGPATEAEKIIAMIQKAVMSDPTLNHLALDTNVAGVSVDIEAEPEKVIEGSVFFGVSYRHDLDDPKTYMGEPPPPPQPVSLT